MQPIQLEHPPVLRVDRQDEAQTAMRVERWIVWNLLRHLEAKGFESHSARGNHWKRGVKTNEAAMEQIFGHPSCWVEFRKFDGTVCHRHDVFFVRGNGANIISDFTFSVGDTDGFAAAVEHFNNKRAAAIMKAAKSTMTRPVRVVVRVEGGLVTGVFADQAHAIDVAVLDVDNMKSSDDEADLIRMKALKAELDQLYEIEV